MKTSNEEIIAALLQHGTIKEAAAAVGVSPRTIYSRMTERDFLRDYSEAKSELYRHAVYSINAKLSAAIDTVAEIMESEDANPAVRLQAAQVIINNAAKLSERLAKEEYSRRWDFD